MPTTTLRAPSRDADSVKLSLRAAEDGEIIHISPWHLSPSFLGDTQPFRRCDKQTNAATPDGAAGCGVRAC